MPSLPLQSLASTRLFLMNRWTDSLLSCKKRWLRNQADSTVKSQARFHVIKSKWEIVIQLVQVESLILRLASKFPGRRDQLLFLINNYDVVRLKDHVIQERSLIFHIIRWCPSSSSGRRTTRRSLKHSGSSLRVEVTSSLSRCWNSTLERLLGSSYF